MHCSVLKISLHRFFLFLCLLMVIVFCTFTQFTVIYETVNQLMGKMGNNKTVVH